MVAFCLDIVLLVDRRYLSSRKARYPNDLICMDPCIVDDSVEMPTRCSFVIELSSHSALATAGI